MTAGADALTALDRVRDAWAVWERGSDEQGRSDAYHHAQTLLSTKYRNGAKRQPATGPRGVR